MSVDKTKANQPPRAQAYPLDLVRTRLAAQTTSRYYHGIGGTLATIVRDEGLGGLYRGVGPTLLQTVCSVSQAGPPRSQRVSCTVARTPHTDCSTAAQCLAHRRVAWVTCSLIDNCSAQVPSLALNYCAYETMRSRWLCLTNSDTPSVRTSAPSSRSLTVRGQHLSCAGLVCQQVWFSCAAVVARMPAGKSALSPKAFGVTQVATSLVCGSLAGLVSSTATFPLDLVRRRLQLEGRAGSQYRWAYHAWLHLLAGCPGLGWLHCTAQRPCNGQVCGS